MTKKDTKFQKGKSGNPSGRKKGSRNRATVALDALFEGEGEALTRKVIELALEGDTTALKLCLERICPPRKGRAISLDLPRINDGAGVVDALGAIIAAAADGDIIPAEARDMAALVDCQLKALAQTEIEDRLTALEMAVSR